MLVGVRSAREFCWVVIGLAAGCSPSVSSTRQNGDGLGNAGGAGALGGAGNGASGGFGTAGDPGVIIVTQGGSSGGGGVNGQCAGTTTVAEQRVVDIQVPVTTEVVTKTPVALYFMQDQSGSMLFPGSFNNLVAKWDQTKTALTAFVNDPGSVGIDVAIQYFALPAGGCDGKIYATPEVPMGPLPANAQPIVNSLAAHLPSTGTPIEPALLGVTQYCIEHTTTAEKCVAVLITDGAPSECQGDPVKLAQIAADAYAKGVITFAIGMDGADYNMLNGIAAAGHGDCTPPNPGNEACNVSAGGSAFIDALNTIRGSVTKTETHLETHQETQQSKLACEFALPDPPPGEKFDKEKVNVAFTNTAGKQDIYNVPTLGDCAAASNKGWYYDDPTKPTKILVCPGTCTDIGGGAGDGGVVVSNGPAPRVDISLGCATKRGPA
jgi:hypothetical protein